MLVMDGGDGAAPPRCPAPHTQPNHATPDSPHTNVHQHEVPTEYLVALTVHLQNILRNKRCLLAYMQVGAPSLCLFRSAVPLSPNQPTN